MLWVSRSTLSLPFMCLGMILAAPGWSQSIATDGNIETDAQLVSTVATGTPPLMVSSTTLVSSLNADRVDGVEGTALALDADLQDVETLLVALLAQFPELGKVPLPRTGQTTCYDVAGALTMCGTGIGLAQDGHLQLGVAWPNPRFTKNGDGTVTDNLTGLIWLENANCAAVTMTWAAALAFANTLFDGSVGHNGGDCGLSDASAAGAWRLPNRFELESLLDLGFINPAMSNTAGTGQWAEGDPFIGVLSSNYWSSTTYAFNTTSAWNLSFSDGSNGGFLKSSSSISTWPVRGGQ